MVQVSGSSTTQKNFGKVHHPIIHQHLVWGRAIVSESVNKHVNIEEKKLLKTANKQSSLAKPKLHGKSKIPEIFLCSFIFL